MYTFFLFPGNCKAGTQARHGMTIKLSDEFLNIGVPLGTYKLMIDNEITDSVNCSWTASDKDRMPYLIWPRLDGGFIARLVKLQRNMLSTVICNGCKFAKESFFVYARLLRDTDIGYLANCQLDGAIGM